MTKFSAKFEDKELQETLKRLQEVVDDLEPTMQQIGEYLLIATDARFEKEISPDGRKWQPLSRMAIEEKKATGKILKILQRTGLMRSRIAYQTTKDSVTLGVNDEKAAKHQLGIGVPKREFIGISEQDRQEILLIIEDSIQDAING